MEEIAEQFTLPEAIEKSFSNRGYYGSFSHDVKGTYVYYLGWFDGNPATLNPLPRTEAAKRTVEMMGGADAVIEKARAYYDQGDYRWVAEVVDNVVFADPQNQEAKDLVADAFEQMGYQAESGVWRNFYLAGAQELRNGVAELPTPTSVTPDTLKAMSLDLSFDYMAVRVNHPKADGKHIALNFDFPDVGESYAVELENGVLNHTSGLRLASADAAVTLDRATLDTITLGKTTMKDAIAAGEVKIDGDPTKLGELMSYLDTFPFWFDIVTPNEVATY
jgi:alkyl sulfatase BDS1-like metallo-beta-lactamase superfamily hydrolase